MLISHVLRQGEIILRGLIFALLLFCAQASAVEVTRTVDLYADAQLAKTRALPLLIMFSMDGCHYCDLVREDFLEPMLLSGDYKDRIIIRMLKVDDYSNVRNFDGSYTTADDIATQYNAFVTPTVVFVDYRGHELAERLLGISTPDFYGGYLDDAIALSLQRLRGIRLSKLPGKFNETLLESSLNK